MHRGSRIGRRDFNKSAMISCDVPPSTNSEANETTLRRNHQFQTVHMNNVEMMEDNKSDPRTRTIHGEALQHYPRIENPSALKTDRGAQQGRILHIHTIRCVRPCGEHPLQAHCSGKGQGRIETQLW
jgi:hypothetical protein